MSKIWNRVKKIRGIYQNHKAPYLIKNNNHITNEEEVAELMASHYETISSNDSYNQKFQRHRAIYEKQLNFSTSNELNYNSSITILELKRMLAISANTAAGGDQITYNMIQKSHETCQQFLVAFNKVFDSGEIPPQWQTSIVLSFSKPGKDPTVEENHRPISLTSCVGKLLEKIINNRLISFLESHSHLPSNKYGFRKMHSTMDALTKLTSYIATSLNQKKSVVCVSFDMRKAYDTTWRYGIVEASYNFGIRGKLSTYIQSFLKNRTFRTKIGTTLSEPHRLDQGVPQGGVLSCTLFSIAINNILKCIPTNIEASLYVDDLIIYCGGNHVPGLERRIQGAINKICTWADSHGFTFSASKTNCIHFHHKKGFQQPLKLLLDRTIIPNRESIKYLGMIIDRKLDWKDHIKMTKLDCLKRLDLLKHLSHMSWGSDRLTMLRLYRAIIRSNLDYGSFIYSSAKESTIGVLDPIHNAAIRLSTGAYRSSPVFSLYAESGEPPLRIRRNQLLLQYYARTLQLQTTTSYQIVQPSNATDNQRPIKILTTADQIANSISGLNLEIATLTLSIKDVPTWQLPPDVKCNKYEYPKKDNCNDNEMKYLFFAHKNECHTDQYPIFTDGSKSSYGVGCAATSLGGQRKMKLHNDSSIFTAELCGLFCGLQLAHSLEHHKFIIFCDSTSALMVTDHYDSLHPIIRKIIVLLIKLRRKGKSIEFCWSPAHIGIPGNEAADKLAAAAATDNSLDCSDVVPCRDWYPVIKGKMRETWTEEWHRVQNNKLRLIKTSTEPWQQLDNRKDSIILTRLRIGHTKLTHQYLMEKNHIPYCEDCIVPLTVKHVLAECPSYLTERLQFFPEVENLDPDATLTLMLAEQPNSPYNFENTKRYLREIEIYDRIV